jgi:hypothetical protein
MDAKRRDCRGVSALGEHQRHSRYRPMRNIGASGREARWALSSDEERCRGGGSAAQAKYHPSRESVDIENLQ